MQKYTSLQLKNILKAELKGAENLQITSILTDSRNYHTGNNKAFIALVGQRHNGHDHVTELYQKELRVFIVSEFRNEYKKLKDAAFILCENTLEALHKIAEHERNKFNGKLVSITGSNGKTSVKEWLFHILKFNQEIIRSPKSYNSQIGVPLSLLLLNNNYDTAIIEAGISMPNEMEKLERIIKPDIGIFTGQGDAHRENFISPKQKLSEKLKLFKNAKLLICNSDDIETLKQIKTELPNTKLFTWGKNTSDNLIIIFKPDNKGTALELEYDNRKFQFHITQKDKAAKINIGHCLAYIFSQNAYNQIDTSALTSLPNIEMRLEQIKGINNCTIINDAYNSDVNALSIALDLLKNQTTQKNKSLILSDIKQCRKHKDQLYKQVAKMIYEAGITKFTGIGVELSNRKHYFNKISQTNFFPDTTTFLKNFNKTDFKNEAILTKGAREFTFEQISSKLQEKKHQTRLEINLEALEYNLNYFKSKLASGTRIMAMVKALSYGSGTHEIANLLRHQKVDYLATALTDEGIRLRKEGIRLPIMVMNPEPTDIDSLIEYNLEPEIYSFESLDTFLKKIRMHTNRQHGIHIKINTGMNRLGFDTDEIPKLISKLKTVNAIKIRSVFSHLAAADELKHDDFTREQITKFEEVATSIQNNFEYTILRHIANSSGALRFPEAHFDMVRIGIGLYGFGAENPAQLHNVSSLISHISQIRELSADETVGYSRMGKLKRRSRIAVIPIGYADGLRRSLSNGNWNFIINKQKAPIVGNICMDMCMADVTDIPAQVGDEVIIFGNEQTADEMAKKLNTIPYEVITSIGDRVKRVYYHC